MGYLAEGMQQGRREEGSKQQWMMSAGQLAIMMRIIMVSACQFVKIPFFYSSTPFSLSLRRNLPSSRPPKPSFLSSHWISPTKPGGLRRK